MNADINFSLHLLRLLLSSQQVPVQTMSVDERLPKPSLENSNISEGLQKRNLNNGVLEKFAEDLTEDIIQSFKSQMELVEPEVDLMMSGFNQNLDTLAEDFASGLVEVALRELYGGPDVEGHSEGFQSSTDQSQRKRDYLDMDTDTDPGPDTPTSRVGQTCHQPQPRSWLPVMGSLEYPDAPPTTPLLPELERSRSSFARKLKGGLAKVFLPSPPPPTPMDKEGNPDSGANHARVELMEHLMQSLPEDDLARGCFEAGPQHTARLEAFAEALSCDIVDWVSSPQNKDQLTGDSDLLLLAHRLAETVISSSLDEVKVLI